MNIWPFVPQQQITEQWHFVTDVIACKTQEQRVSLRPYPRTEIAMQFHLTPTQFEAATIIFKTAQLGAVWVPLWNECISVGSISSGASSITVDTTTSRYIDGGYIFIIGSSGNYELAQITTVNAMSLDLTGTVGDDYSGAYVCPAHQFYFKNGVTIKKQAASFVIAEATFESDVNYELTGVNPYTAYNGSYVLTDRSVVNAGDDALQRSHSQFDNVAGKITNLKDVDYDAAKTSVSWVLLNRTDLFTFMRWLIFMSGRQKSNYIPRWTRDFIPNKNFLSTDDGIFVDTNQYADNDYTGHICVVENDGTLHFHEVTSVQNISSSQDKLALSSTVGYDLDTDNIEMICRLVLMRPDSDTISLNYKSADVTEVTIDFVEIPE